MSPDRIRRITREDAEAVSALSGQLGYPVSAEVVAARLERVAFGEDDALRLLVAVPDIVRQERDQQTEDDGRRAEEGRDDALEAQDASAQR